MSFCFSETLKRHWDTSKTLQENMKHLGLAYDSNSNAVGIEKRKKFSRKKVLKLNILKGIHPWEKKKFI